MIERAQRIPFRDPGTLKPEEAALTQGLLIEGQVLNIAKVFIQHPELMRAWLPFAMHILREQSLPFREREILILRIGWLNQSPYEWGQHCRLAREGGLSDEDIARIEGGPDCAGWEPHERLLVQAVDDLYENSVISNETWAGLSRRYDHRQMLDVVFTVGQYNMVSWALNSTGVPLDSYLLGTGS